MMSLLQRYVIAAIAFVLAVVWLGVGLMRGLECLLVFLLVSLIVAVVQRRQAVVVRRDSRRAIGAEAKVRRPEAAAVRERRHARRSESPPWPSRSLDDGDGGRGDWTRPVEHRW